MSFFFLPAASSVLLETKGRKIAPASKGQPYMQLKKSSAPSPSRPSSRSSVASTGSSIRPVGTPKIPRATQRTVAARPLTAPSPPIKASPQIGMKVMKGRPKPTVLNSSLPRSTVDPRKEKAAIMIQKHWRGYKTRNLDTKVTKLLGQLRAERIEEYITDIVKKNKYVVILHHQLFLFKHPQLQTSKNYMIPLNALSNEAMTG